METRSIVNLRRRLTFSLKKIPLKNREITMNHSNQISNCFNFLVSLGYKELIYSNNAVRYNNGTVIIEVLYNEYCYEIESYFILVNGSEKISLSDFLLYLGIKRIGTYQIPNRDKLNFGLSYIANSIKQVLYITDNKNCESIIRNALLFTQNNRQNKLSEINQKADFDAAEKYWKDKNYNEVKIIYRKYYDSLPCLYKDRLSYIEKKVKENS